MPPPGEPLVDARELLGVVVEPVLAHLVGEQVDGEPGHRRGTLVGSVEDGGEHPVVAHDVDDDGVAVLVGVEGVEDEARVDLEPAHVVAAALAGQQAQSRRVVGVPGVGQRVEVPLRAHRARSGRSPGRAAGCGR